MKRSYVWVISKLYSGYFSTIHTFKVGAILHNVNFDLYFFPPMAHAKILELAARERALTCIENKTYETVKYAYNLHLSALSTFNLV